jgi:hypothetical protein
VRRHRKGEVTTYVSYAVAEAAAWWHGKPFGLGSARGRPNLFNALRGLIVFGLPSLYLLLTGRSHSHVDVLLDLEQEESADGGRE